MSASLPTIALIFTGGTIESIGKDRLDAAWYIENNVRLSNRDVIERVPELGEYADVLEVPFRKLPSHALVDRDWLELHKTLTATLTSAQTSGVVITHGTNTLEETAHFLHLTLKSPKTVVLTGAMRPASALSADGDLNLLNAVIVAASPAATGLGVLVVMNDTVISARDAVKMQTYRVQAFAGRDVGPLGFVEADHSVVICHMPSRPHTLASEFDVSQLDELPRVDVVVSYVGADGTFIDAAIASGTKGVVSAGTGAGRPTPAEDAAIDRAVERGVIVCISTRVPGGRVVRSPVMRHRGLVAGGDLPPWKARTLLALALTLTEDRDVIQEMFDRY